MGGAETCAARGPSRAFEDARRPRSTWSSLDSVRDNSNRSIASPPAASPETHGLDALRSRTYDFRLVEAFPCTPTAQFLVQGSPGATPAIGARYVMLASAPLRRGIRLRRAPGSTARRPLCWRAEGVDDTVPVGANAELRKGSQSSCRLQTDQSPTGRPTVEAGGREETAPPSFKNRRPHRA